jgi:hypothetical protein
MEAYHSTISPGWVIGLLWASGFENSSSATLVRLSSPLEGVGQMSEIGLSTMWSKNNYEHMEDFIADVYRWGF